MASTYHRINSIQLYWDGEEFYNAIESHKIIKDYIESTVIFESGRIAFDLDIIHEKQHSIIFKIVWKVPREFVYGSQKLEMLEDVTKLQLCCDVLVKEFGFVMFEGFQKSNKSQTERMIWNGQQALYRTILAVPVSEKHLFVRMFNECENRRV